MHIDVNSAFLSWSAVKLLREGQSLDIRNEVAVIAGSEAKRRGIVVAASIPAKRLGIKSPENLYEARKKCRNLMVIRPDYEFYRKCSLTLMKYLNHLFPEMEQYSIDECFVDYTSMKKIYGDEIKFAHKLKNDIYKRFGFTVNIGIGNNKLCAKMASDFEKPNNVHTLYINEIKTKMWPLDISELFMAGKAACKKLKQININTIGDLATSDQNMIIGLLKSQGKMLYEYSNGIDNSKVEYEYVERKGIGFSRTLEMDEDNKSELYSLLRIFSKDISKILRKKHFYSDVFIVTIRYASFKTVNHQIKYKNSTNIENEIFERSKQIFDKLWNKEPIRLLGLRASSLTHNNDIQLSLFDKIDMVNKDKKTQDIIDKINDEFGKNTIIKGNELL